LVHRVNCRDCGLDFCHYGGMDLAKMKCKYCKGSGYLVIINQPSMHGITDQVCEAWVEGMPDQKIRCVCNEGNNSVGSSNFYEVLLKE